MNTKLTRKSRSPILKRLEKREQKLSPFAVRSFESLGRIRRESFCPVRSEFQRDRDRIIHSNSFRRLKHKSQVFVAPRGDHFTTRLTHVIEVSQVARTIARALNLNEDLVEATALGHDLGHTPFGHIGEAVLNEMLDSGFHHSIHSVRIVEELEKEGKGLNLTKEVIDGIRHHSKPQGHFLSKETVKDLSLEAQIVRISDALAYLAHDMNDALRSSYLTLQEFPDSAIRILGFRHSERVNTLVTDVIDASWDCTGELKQEIDKPWIRMSDPVAESTIDLRNFMFENFYLPISASLEGKKASEVVRVLFCYFKSNIDKIPKWLREHSESPEQAAADYVCGMTDNYALTLAEQVRPGLSQGIFDGRI